MATHGERDVEQTTVAHRGTDAQAENLAAIVSIDEATVRRIEDGMPRQPDGPFVP